LSANIRADAVEALKNGSLLEKLAAVGTGDVAGAQLVERIKREIGEVSKIAKEANITLD
jgi:hypothetical protein